MGRLGFWVVLFLLASAMMMGCLTGTAAASPGALRILIMESQCEASKPASTLQSALLAKPGVAAVEFLDGAGEVPTGAQLLGYDAVVAMGDCGWLNAGLAGDALADYEERGGVVIGATFSWEFSAGVPEEWALGGRWVTGGFSPFLGGEALFGSGTFESTAASPLLEGVGPLSASSRDAVALAPGATQLGKWSDGSPAVAVKGNALGVNSYLGDYAPSGTGDYAQLIVNAARLLGPKALTVTRSGGGSGAVASSPAGISCGATCSANFPNAAAVTLTATASAGSQFAGWSGAGCSGTGTCVLTMTAAASVEARFEPKPPVPEQTCVVPALKGKRLKAAKGLLSRAHCRLGKVTPAKQKSGLIVKQKPAAGTVLPAQGEVSVRLKGHRRHHKHHAKGHR